MSVIALVNRKGGVGKTTLTVALADFLSCVHMKRVLILDLDSQANASLFTMGEERWAQLNENELTIVDLLTRVRDGDAPPAEQVLADFIQQGTTRPVGFGELHVLCSTPRLQDFEDDFVAAPDAFRYVSPYHLLAGVLGRVILRRYDYVLIDCPPSLNLVTLNGLSCADGYLVPIIPDYVSTVGLPQLVEGIRVHARHIRRQLKMYGTLINRLKPQTRLHQNILAELRVKPEAQPVWDTMIHDSVRAEEILNVESLGRSLKQLYGVQYERYKQLADEFRRRIP